MKIGIIANHSFPIPMKNLHTGDIVILQMAQAMAKMGHTVNLYAPEGTISSGNGKVFHMRASYGKYPPSSEECELECFAKYSSNLREEDIVHDFSVSKKIVQSLNEENKKNTCCTLMGGAWTHTSAPNNLIVWSYSHRDRVIRGATDYEGTPTPDLAGHTGKAVKDAHIVNGGVDTSFYIPTPTCNKKNFFLWMNRWHSAKGYKQAIELARATGIELVLAGEHPDNELFEYQKQCALEAISMAKGLSNVHFEFLPLDPEHHNTKLKFYQEAKALIYSVQFCEPFGLSQTEALSCGTPVIGTDYGSVSEVISNGKTGFVCQNNVKSFANAIDKIDIIDNYTCRLEAIKRFDISVMATNYLNQYKMILNGGVW